MTSDLCPRRAVTLPPPPVFVPVAAQNIHEAVREAVRSMRVLPSFNHSPQHCRPKYQDKPVKVRLPGPRVTLPTRTAASPPQLASHQPDAALRPSLRLSPPAFHHATMETAAERRHCGMEDWRPEDEEDEGEKEGVGYMMMAQVSPGSSALPDDYVVMASPQKPDSSAVQTSVSR